MQIITPPLRGALIFTLFWGFRKFRGALIFFKNFAEILGCVYLHEFWWGALIFTFFLVDFSKDLHCKTPVLQKKIPLRGPNFWGAFIFAFFRGALIIFTFQLSENFEERLLFWENPLKWPWSGYWGGGYYLQYPGSLVVMIANWWTCSWQFSTKLRPYSESLENSAQMLYASTFHENASKYSKNTFEVDNFFQNQQ